MKFTCSQANVLFLLLALLFVQSSCSKKDDSQLKPDPSNSISWSEVTLNGAITLPAGAPRNANRLKLVSPIAQGTISAGHYALVTMKDEFTTQIASDSTGEPVLMGYNYPEQTDFDLNARSTALALLMNTPAASSLSAAGRVALVHRLQSEGDFTALSIEIEAVLRTNRALLNTRNIALATAINKLFVTVARRETSSTNQYLGIGIYPGAEPKMVFTNKGAFFTHVVGVYKNGVKVQELTVDGYSPFPSSVTDMAHQATQAYNHTATLLESSYAFAGDGDYDVKVRTGRPGSGDGSSEYASARNKNCFNAVLTLFKFGVPWLKGGCISALQARIYGTIANSVDLRNAQNALQFTAVVNDITSITLGLGTDIFKNCIDKKDLVNLGAANTFMQGLSKYFLILNVVQTIGNGINLTLFVPQWLSAPSALDTCFQVNGNAIAPCQTLHMEIITGNNQYWPIGREMRDYLEFRVLDQNNKPVPNLTPTFTASDGGQFNSWGPSSNAGFIGAVLGRWTLGNKQGPQTLTVTVVSASGKSLSTPLVFSATAAPPNAVTFAFSSSTTGCTGLSFPQGQAYSITLNGITRSHTYAGCAYSGVAFDLPRGTYTGSFTWSNTDGTTLNELLVRNSFCCFDGDTIVWNSRSLSGPGYTLSDAPLIFTPTGSTGSSRAGRLRLQTTASTSSGTELFTVKVHH